MSKEVLSRHLKDALENLYDPIRLQIHPLLDLLDVPRGPGQSAGEALRQLLWDVIESLSPPASMLPGRPEWLSYQILWLHYVQAMDRATICQQLALSEASFYRRQREGLDAVADVLYERYGRDNARDAAIIPSELHAGGDQARDEAIRLARRSERQTVNLCTLIEEVQKTIQPLLEQQGITLRISASADMPNTYGDPAMLQQAILNILAELPNLASGKRLYLDISIAGTESQWELWPLDRNGEAAGDTAILKRFSLSQGLLAVYGGRIWLDQKLPDRLVLAFTLPVSKRRTILILDDDEDTVRLYRRYLQKQGYAIHIISDADNLETQLAGTTLDLILLDVLMPKIDGWHVLQYLKTRPETMHVPVIVCSVLSQPRLALALGASKVLLKPIERETLLQAIEALLGEDNPGEAHR